MVLRSFVLVAVAIAASSRAIAQESAGDAALRQVRESREQRAIDRIERVDALNARIRAGTGRDDGDLGTRSGSAFERQERPQRNIERQVGRELSASDRRLQERSSVSATLTPQGRPFEVVDPMRTTGRRVLDLREPATAQRWRSTWRRDPRHDWRSIRQREPERFRFAPPARADRTRLRIGAVAQVTTAQWIREPWSLGLPPVSGPYRWARVGRAAVLIDRRDGRVVDLVDDFYMPSAHRR